MEGLKYGVTRPEGLGQHLCQVLSSANKLSRLQEASNAKILIIYPSGQNKNE